MYEAIEEQENHYTYFLWLSFIVVCTKQLVTSTSDPKKQNT